MASSTHTPASTTRDQSRDTGLAMVLLLLLAHAATHRTALATAAIIVLVVTMTAPAVFRPLAVVWFGLSRVLGAVMSRVLLALVFFVVVTPIGLLRRLLGHDALRRRAFKAGTASVMHARHHTFSGRDLEKPY